MTSKKKLHTRLLLVATPQWGAIRYIILARRAVAQAAWLKHSNKSKSRDGKTARKAMDALEILGRDTFVHINRDAPIPNALVGVPFTEDEYKLLLHETAKYRKGMEITFKDVKQQGVSKEATKRAEANYLNAAAYAQLVRDNVVVLDPFMRKLKDRYEVLARHAKV